MSGIPIEEEIRMFRRLQFWRRVAILFAACCVILIGSKIMAQSVECHATPTPRLKFSSDVLFNSGAAAFTNPRNVTFYDVDVRIHVTHEPIVEKEGNGWLIRFK